LMSESPPRSCCRWSPIAPPLQCFSPEGISMEPTKRAFLGLVLGGICGAVATATVGAVIGLALWATGLGFAYSWADWPVGGAIFGAVVGGVGGAISGAARGA